jgi:steroid delta-isomerase-like uncharacterized protein
MYIGPRAGRRRTMEQGTAVAAGDREFVEDFGQRFLDAWNSHDADKVVACMAEDIVYDDDAWPTTMRAHADVRAFLEYLWRAFPDLHFEVVDGPYIDPEAPKAAWYWRGVATHSGPLDPPGVAATGERLEFHGGQFDEYRDGKLVRLRIVMDMADAMRELGVLPAAGGRAERVIARLASVPARFRRH